MQVLALQARRVVASCKEWQGRRGGSIVPARGAHHTCMSVRKRDVSIVVNARHLHTWPR